MLGHAASPLPSSPALLAQLASRANRKLTWAVRLGLLATLAAGGAGAAFADGIVVQSAAAGFHRGDQIGEGQTIVLAAGESLIVLDQSGVKITMERSGDYSSALAGKAPQARKLDALRAAVWSERRPDMGGTRAGELNACLKSIAGRRDFTEEDCRNAYPEAPESPTLNVEILSGAAAKSGDALRLRLTANFEAAVSCVIGTVQDPDAGYPLVLADDGLWIMVDKGRPVAVAKGKSTADATMTAPAVAGDYKLTCRAVEAEIWREVGAAAPAAPYAEFVDMLGDFARMRTAPSARTVQTYSVAGPAPSLPSPGALDSIADKQ